jgi:hypothetical protein
MFVTNYTRPVLPALFAAQESGGRMLDAVRDRHFKTSYERYEASLVL